jgi:N-acetylmuramoyl-L-alanine amidase
MTKPLFALCVGHSRSGDRGAVSVDGTSEHFYNSDLARRIRLILADQGIETVVINNYEGHGYTAAMQWLADHLKQLGARGCVELHFNSSENDAATGHEFLFWRDSYQGRELARSIDWQFRQTIEALKPRGIKPITMRERGAEFLRLTPCPAVICEPFFGSNDRDWKFATTEKDEIALAIATGIAAWWKGLKL